MEEIKVLSLGDDMDELNGLMECNLRMGHVLERISQLVGTHHEVDPDERRHLYGELRHIFRHLQRPVELAGREIKIGDKLGDNNKYRLN